MTAAFVFITLLGALGWGLFTWAMFERAHLQRELADLYAKPLSYWKHRDTMMRLTRLSLNRFAESFQREPQVFPRGSNIVSFRRPRLFQPKVSDMVDARPGAEL